MIFPPQMIILDMFMLMRYNASKRQVNGKLIKFSN